MELNDVMNKLRPQGWKLRAINLPGTFLLEQVKTQRKIRVWPKRGAWQAMVGVRKNGTLDLAYYKDRGLNYESLLSYTYEQELEEA